MKKYIQWIIPVVLFVLILIFYTLVPSIYKTAFIIRHLLIFSLIAYFFLWSTIRAYRCLVRGRSMAKGRKIVLISFTSVICITFLLVLSELQMRYVTEYEIPPLGGCSYYDRYDNLIYKSSYLYLCPELENLEYKEKDGMEVLTFTVTEVPEGQVVIGYDENKPIKIKAKHLMKNEFEYVYAYKGELEKITMISRVDKYQEDELVGIIGLKRIIENTSHPFEKQSVQRTYRYSTSVEKGETPQLPNFDDLDPTVVIYQSNVTQSDAYGHHYLIDISETRGKEEVDVFVMGEITYIPQSGLPMEIELYEYENGRYNKHSKNYQFMYDQIVIEWEKPMWSSESKEGTTIYTRDKGDRFFLSSYTVVDFMAEQGRKVSVKKYSSKGNLYIVEPDQTSVVINKSYGKKVEHYKTYRRNLKYPPVVNQGDDFQAFYTESYYRNLEEMYDYRTMLEANVGHEIYQDNFLLEGFHLKVNDPDTDHK